MAPVISDKSLEIQKLLGDGGFGKVYRARHKDRGDVAVKILRDGISPLIPLCDEAKLMNEASSKYVVQCYGIYEGCQPGGGRERQGIVMEFMERESVAALQKKLPGPPPWPLVFRWACQVSQSIKFLHSQQLVHQDLKPSNVLLDIDLNAKLSDFGLTSYSSSIVKSKRETKEYSIGTYQYKPPEAFEDGYKPVRAYDIYSYGILLWSIVSGEEPYGDAPYRRVKMAICDRQRPDCEEMETMEVDGLKELVNLMKRCWDHCITKRPSSEVCSEVTENLFLNYKTQVHEAVFRVSAKLDSKTSNHSETSGAPFVPLQKAEQAESNDTVDLGRLNKAHRSSRQQDPSNGKKQAGSHDTVDIQRLNKTDSSSRQQDPVNDSDKEMSNEEKKTFVDDNRKYLIRLVSEVMAIIEELKSKGMVHREAYSRIKSERTNEARMTEFYDTVLLSGGQKVKAAFYNALKIHHPTLARGDFT